MVQRPPAIHVSDLHVTNRILNDVDKSRTGADFKVTSEICYSQPVMAPLTLRAGQGMASPGESSAAGGAVIPTQDINSQFETKRREKARLDQLRQMFVRNGTNNKKNIDIDKRQSVAVQRTSAAKEQRSSQQGVRARAKEAATDSANKQLIRNFRQKISTSLRKSRATFLTRGQTSPFA